MSDSKTPRQRYFEAPIRAAEGIDKPVFETGIPMRDGIELATDVYLPRKVDLPAPAIVQSTPYDKSTAIFFLDEARFYQERGYAVVVHDVRGRGKSEGQWRAFVHDGQDTHDVIEWVANQDWCTGKVGTTGLSYMGWTQWAAAAERPPASHVYDLNLCGWPLATRDSVHVGRVSTLLRLVGVYGPASHCRIPWARSARLGQYSAPSPTDYYWRIYQSGWRHMAGHAGTRHFRRPLAGAPF